MELANLTEAYEGSFYTVVGAGGDLDEWVKGYGELLKTNDIGEVTKWFRATGADVNKFTGVKRNSDNAFPDDLTFLMFPLDELNVGKLAMFKLAYQDRWFDDIVDNTRHFEGV